VNLLQALVVGDDAQAVIDLAVERHKKNLRSERPSAEQPQLVSVRDEADQARYVVAY
jgi:DNA helicase II / ATP-dependent DNA helicase PcrA